MAAMSKLFNSKRQRIYIIPTGFGAIFLAGAAVMILIGSAYQNNLVNLLAFFMLSLIFVSMVQTHHNLVDLEIDSVDSEGGFKGEQVVVITKIINRSKTSRHNLESRIKELKPTQAYESSSSLGPQGIVRLRASYPARARGRHAIRRVRVSSVYPLGLFTAWRYFTVDAHYVVYPERAGARTPPVKFFDQDQVPAMMNQNGDDFYGHRKFNPGDSQRHVDWKARARGRPFLVKQFSEGSAGSWDLTWDATEGLAREERLSQLASWVDQARQARLIFSMSVPGLSIGPGQGQAHAVRCWEALAEQPENESSVRHVAQG